MRKIYVSKNSFQWRYTVFLFLLVSIITVVVALSVYFTLWIELLKGGVSLHVLLIKTSKILLLKLGFLFIFEIILCFIVSHRIVGPIVRIEEVIELIRSGDLSKDIKIRKTDEFIGLVDKINQSIKNLREQIKKDKDQIGCLKMYVKELSVLLREEGIDKNQVSALLADIDGKIGKMEQTRNYFKI